MYKDDETRQVLYEVLLDQLLMKGADDEGRCCPICGRPIHLQTTIVEEEEYV